MRGVEIMLERFFCTPRRADFLPFPVKPSLLKCEGMEVRGKGMWNPQRTKSNQVFCSSATLLCIFYYGVPNWSHLRLVSTSANIMPITGYHGLLAHMQSSLIYTLYQINTSSPNTVLNLKVRDNEMAFKWEKFISPDFPLSGVCPSFCFAFQRKRKKNLIRKHPHPSKMIPGLDPGQLTQRLILLSAVAQPVAFLEEGWPDPSRDPQGHPSALSAPFCHVHVAGMVHGQWNKTPTSLLI